MILVVENENLTIRASRDELLRMAIELIERAQMDEHPSPTKFVFDSIHSDQPLRKKALPNGFSLKSCSFSKEDDDGS